MSKKKLVIFVKAPRPGFVKSRLAASLGPDTAANAYKTLVGVLLTHLTTPLRSRRNRANAALTTQFAVRSPQSAIPNPKHFALRTSHSIELRFTPDDAFAEIQPWLRPTWTAAAQGPGNLGDRMQRAFRGAFAAGAKRVVLIGSDCPTIGADDIQKAWTALASHDLVLGPATDGGYWLIGLTSAQPALFEGIAWSTNSVLRETRQRADRISLRVHLLSQRTDVDTITEWREFLRAQSAS